jgi:arginine decarboxylase
MNDSYFDLLEEYLTNSPEFQVSNKGELSFYDVDIMKLVKEHGTPLKVTYLPKISSQIVRAKEMFSHAFEKTNYSGKYLYCYCTKSSHFSFILNEVLKNDAHIETSSAFDIPIVNKLHQQGKITKDTYVVCNGFKRPEYTLQISKLINRGFTNVIPVLDNENELEVYLKKVKKPFKLGIRIATEEMPNFSFYTSRLGFNPKSILPFFRNKMKNLEHAKLKMLHFFINTGIKDHGYYWNELDKCLQLYVALKKECPSLDSLNIGGGLPFKTHLSFQYDFQDFIDKIITKIKEVCEREGVDSPDIFTEFGTYTVAESAMNIYSVLDEKQQNDKESWYMINNSFMNTVPDAWGMDQRFLVLPINKWMGGYKPVYLGGLTCDSMDFYNAEIHNNKLFLPPLDNKEPLYVGLFNTGAYQDALTGFGGLKHCLVPSPKYIVLNKNENGEIISKEFKEEQSAAEMLKILGYK